MENNFKTCGVTRSTPAPVRGGCTSRLLPMPMVPQKVQCFLRARCARARKNCISAKSLLPTRSPPNPAETFSPAPPSGIATGGARRSGRAAPGREAHSRSPTSQCGRLPGRRVMARGTARPTRAFPVLQSSSYPKTRAHSSRAGDSDRRLTADSRPSRPACSSYS